jgi:hypothetical protein
MWTAIRQVEVESFDTGGGVMVLLPITGMYMNLRAISSKNGEEKAVAKS